MKAFTPKQLKYKDRLAKKRRHKAAMWIAASVFCAILLAGLIVYVIFFASLLKINSLSISKLETVKEEQVSKYFDAYLGIKTFKHLEINRNILFSDFEPLREALLKDFPQFESVSVEKKYFHQLAVNIVERKPEGVWCRQTCSYFDANNAIWGQATQMSGSLMLSVEDQRSAEFFDGVPQGGIDVQFIGPIRDSFYELKNMNLGPLKVVIANNSFRDFRIILSRGTQVIFSIQTPIEEQLTVLEALLKGKDDNFKPSYIDLRVAKRAYVK